MYNPSPLNYAPITDMSKLSADELAAELQTECAVLEYDIAEFKARMKQRSLPKAAGALALAAGKSAGQKTLSQARRDPLPFAAALGGVGWLVANVLASRKSADKMPLTPGEPQESPTGLPSGYVPALGLILAAGTIAGARLAGKKTQG